MNTFTSKSYDSQPIAEGLNSFSAKELRHAANVIDREKGKFPPINTLSLSRKLDALEATLVYTGDESGWIKFWLDEKNNYVIRRFTSITELTTAVNLGPVDLNWECNLYLKNPQGILWCKILEYCNDKSQMRINVPDLFTDKYIYVNGAEKILCNSDKGLTAGQMKLNK